MEQNSSYRKQLRKNFVSEKPFDFTEFVEMQKEENEIDLGLFFELAEEDKIMCNQVPVNTVIEDMEEVKDDFLTNGYFTLGDGKEIDFNSFFEDSNELAKFLDKILDKYDDHPSIHTIQGIFIGF